MIFTYAVNKSTRPADYASIPGIHALEYRDVRPLLDTNMAKIFHSGLGIIQEEFIEHFNSIVDFLNDSNFTLFSFDLGPAAEKVGIREYYYVAESNVLSRSDLQSRIRANIAYVKKHFRGDIALENLNYFPSSAYSHVCEAEFIKDIILDNDVYLVLDIAHAAISAHNLKVDTHEYFLRLPFQAVREIHLSAPGIQNGAMRDLHEVPTDSDYALLELIAKYIPGNPYLVVEYYKDRSELANIYRKLSCIYG